MLEKNACATSADVCLPHGASPLVHIQILRLHTAQRLLALCVELRSAARACRVLLPAPERPERFLGLPVGFVLPKSLLKQKDLDSVPVHAFLSIIQISISGSFPF